MRVGTLLAAIVVFVVFVSSLGQAVLWAIAGISFSALLVLIILSARANRFHGPKILYDDAREKFLKFGQDGDSDETVIKIENDKDR